MSFRILGLDPAPFRPLYGLNDAELRQMGVRRCIADRKPAFPDRIELRDAEPGENLLLLNFTHQPADTVYRASHAIFVREVMRVRPISLRAFDADHEMVDAALVDGVELAPLIARFLGQSHVAYLQAHYAKRGCYAARVERA